MWILSYTLNLSEKRKQICSFPFLELPKTLILWDFVSILLSVLPTLFWLRVLDNFARLLYTSKVNLNWVFFVIELVVITDFWILETRMSVYLTVTMNITLCRAKNVENRRFWNNIVDISLVAKWLCGKAFSQNCEILLLSWSSKFYKGDGTMINNFSSDIFSFLMDETLNKKTNFNPIARIPDNMRRVFAD